MSDQTRCRTFEYSVQPAAAGSWFPPPVSASRREFILELTLLEP
jgi:hypothetical protein